MSNENFFYFTAEHNECLEVWENGTLKYSETAPFGELMFNLLKFKYPDELCYFTIKYISTWAHGETVDLFWLDRNMKELPVTYGVRNGALTEMLCSIKAEDVIYYTLCKACAFLQSQKMCTIVCQRCGRYFFNFKYGKFHDNGKVFYSQKQTIVYWLSKCDIDQFTIEKLNKLSFSCFNRPINNYIQILKF